MLSINILDNNTVISTIKCIGFYAVIGWYISNVCITALIWKIWLNALIHAIWNLFKVLTRARASEVDLPYSVLINICRCLHALFQKQNLKCSAKRGSVCRTYG